MAKTPAKTAAPKAAPKAAAAPKKGTAAAPKAAPAPAPEPEPVDPAYAAGDFVRFLGYAELPEGVAPLYEVGDKLEITEVKEDNSFLVVKVGTEDGDTAFPDEIEPWTEEHEAEYLAAEGEEPEEGQEVEEAAEGDEAGEEAEEPEEPEEAEEGEAGEEGGAVAEGEAELDEDAAKETLETARELSTTLEETYFAMGAVLTEIYDGGHYRLAGYETGQFEAYLAEDLGATVSYRKALQLIDIHRTLAPLEINRDRLKEIGWTKAREIVERMRSKPELLQEKFDELIDLAKEKTRDELSSEIRTTYLGETISNTTSTTTTGANADGGARMDTLKFKLFEDQAKTVTGALEAVKTKNELPDHAAALHLIVTEWAQLSEGVEVPLADALSAIETRYGVTVTSKPKGKAAAAAAAPAAATAKGGLAVKAAAPAPQARRRGAPAKVKA